MDGLVRASALWWAWMGPMLLQSSLLILVVGAVDFLIRRWAWPQVRYALWLLVLLKLLLPPAWSLPTALAPRLQQQLEARGVEMPWAGGEASRERTVAAGATTVAPRTTNDAVAPAAVTTAPGAAALRRATVPWTVWAFVAWAAGALALTGMLGARYAALRRWHDRERDGLTIPPWYHELLVQTAERLGMGRLPAIVFSDRLLTPAVCGVLRPVMYLPRDYLDTLTREEAEHVLLHEMAHLKRGDLWLHALGLVVQVVYWFNPLVALARRRTQHVRELCTDLTVASVLRERTAGYRQTLLDTARRLLTESAAPGLGLLGVFEEPFRLVSRLRWLEKPTWKRRNAARATAAVVTAAMLAFVLPMAGGAPPDGAPPQVAADDSRAGGAGHDARALYVRNEIVLEKYFLDVKYETEPRGMSEVWIGADAVAAREGGLTRIYDRARGTFTVVDHESRSYVTAPLPLVVDSLLSADMLARHGTTATTGRVVETGKSRRIQDIPCREFLVESWGTAGGTPDAPVVFRVWAGAGVPHDLDPFREYLHWLRVLYGRDQAYRDDLLKIDGLQVRLERVFKRFPWRQRMVDEVVELELKALPAGVFSPPPDYARRERIERL